MKNKKGSIAWLARCVICMGVLVGIMFGTSACTGGGDEKKSQEETEQNETVKSSESISHRYSNANDRMVYFPLEDTVDDMLMAGFVKQWSLDGTEGDCVILPVEEYGSWESGFDLIWVGNEEIVWSTEDEDGNQKVLSTPIRRTENGETVVPEQTKELFSIKMSRDQISGASTWYPGTVYVDEERIVFVSYGLYVYDRKAGGEPVKVGEAFGEKDTYVYMQDKMYSLTAEVAGDSLFCHTGRTSGKVEEASYEFWDYHMGDGTAKLIDDRCFSDAAYVADSARGVAYYQVIDGRGIWQYDSRTGEKSELISEEMFRTCYEENQLFWEEDACYNDSLFVEGDSLYFIKNLENPQVFSYSLLEGSLSYKKELTEAVRRSGYVDEKSDRMQRLFVIKDKLLLYWDDYDEDEEEYYICIDIPTAKMKPLRDSDSEKIYFGMVGAWEEPDTSAEWKEREKTQESSPEQSQTSLSVKEQLALISRCKDVWMDTSDDGGGPLMQIYAVTDLDHNGRLEVIASSGRQGSGAFTSSEYYQVSEDGTGLRHIRSSEETGAVDIVDGIETAYVEQKTGTYYYCTQDYMSGGAGNRYMWYGAIVLKSGMLTARTYASVEENKKGWDFKYYKDGMEKKVPKSKFDEDSQEEKMFAGCQKKKVSISWFAPGGKKEQTEDKLEKKLRKSYEKFSVK